MAGGQQLLDQQTLRPSNTDGQPVTVFPVSPRIAAQGEETLQGALTLHACDVHVW